LRSYVLRDGRFERAEGLDRGEPVLRSAEEWQDRYICMKKHELKLTMMIFPTLVYAVSGLVIGLVSISVRAFWDLTLFVLGLVSLVIWPTLVIMYFVDRMTWKGPTPGLYEHGAQIYPSLFLPYKELSETTVGKGSVGLVPRTPPRRRPPSIGHPVSWTMPNELLGEDGVAVLVAKVAGKSEGDEPPRLVIYGPGGPG